MSAPVAINARAAARRETGGVERWAQELAVRLPELEPSRYRVVHPPSGFAHGAGQLWEQLALPVAARGSELLLSPANLAPLASRRNVVLIHDAAPFRQSEWYRRTYGVWHRAVVPRVARRARLVVTPSDYIRRELRDRFDLAPERLRAIAPGVAEAFRTPADPDPVLRRLAIERPYVLAVGTEGPRKNLELLDEIAPGLAREGMQVVIAGSTRPYLPEGASPTARRLGYVPEEHLPALYAGAAAFAMPSLYEGFGLPCVEAMAAGTPVVTSDRGALPEACGGAALLVDPRDPGAFAEALLRAAGPERGRLVAAGRERAAALTWERTASELDAALAELLTR